MKTHQSNLIPLIGYVDRLSARPGESLQFKISSILEKPYKTELVRIICADPNPEETGVIEKPIVSNLEKSYMSRQQHFSPGSYGLIHDVQPLCSLQSFSAVVTIWPTTPHYGVQA